MDIITSLIINVQQNELILDKLLHGFCEIYQHSSFLGDKFQLNNASQAMFNQDSTTIFLKILEVLNITR